MSGNNSTDLDLRSRICNTVIAIQGRLSHMSVNQKTRKKKNQRAPSSIKHGITSAEHTFELIII